MRLLYTISILTYFILVRLVSLFYRKAAIWLANRRDWSRVLDTPSDGKKTIWIHAASAGEFEQAIPVIRHIRESGIPIRVAVSFFSASGYTMYKDSDYADLFFHFPPDLPSQAHTLVTKLNPAVAVFIRNEIWWNTLEQLKDQYVPAILINADPGKRSGIYGLYLQHCHAYFFKIFYTDITGNTKAERAAEVAKTAFKDAVLEPFSKDSFVLLLGSCYEKEMLLAASFYKKYRDRFPNLKLVFCPHEWNEQTRSHYQRFFEDPISSYSENPPSSRLLFLNKMGILKYLYRYADAAFIGGGFGKGIHNISEAAANGIPVFIGPNHQKFPEATAMIKTGQVTVINDETGLDAALFQLLNVGHQSEELKENWKQHFAETGNASRIIWKEIEKIIRN